MEVVDFIDFLGNLDEENVHANKIPGVLFRRSDPFEMCNEQEPHNRRLFASDRPGYLCQFMTSTGLYGCVPEQAGMFNKKAAKNFGDRSTGYIALMKY
uniref:Uncharacterized protein n=1 Tax=Romanomermis culicivorax TaxID=13658 RepID=A0A915KT84_ROMCU